MKYLVFMLVLIIAMPTAQAGVCSMGDVQSAAEQAAAHNDEHDCCPDGGGEPAKPEAPCDDGDHCSECCTAFSAVAVAAAVLMHERPEGVFKAPLSSLLSSHSAPPFRPPIS